MFNTDRITPLEASSFRLNNALLAISQRVGHLISFMKTKHAELDERIVSIVGIQTNHSNQIAQVITMQARVIQEQNRQAQTIHKMSDQLDKIEALLLAIANQAGA